MSVTATKTTPAPSQVEPSPDRRIGAEIDAEVPDNKRGLKSGLHGIRDSIESSFQTVTTPLSFDRLSPAESVRRQAHSSHEVQRRMDSLLTGGGRAASIEEDRKASGAGLGAKVASIERPTRRKELKPEAPTRSVSGASSHGPWPHVKVLPSRELILDMPSADTRISDEVTRRQFASAFDSAPASEASPQETGPARKSVGPSAALTAAAWPEVKATAHHGPHPHVKVLPLSLELQSPTINEINRLADRQAGFQLECSMAVARVAAAPIHAAGHAVGATIKELREQSPLVDAMANGAGKAIRSAKTWVKEEVPGAAVLVKDWKAGSARLPSDIEEEYGIPQAKTRQWIEDTSAIATTAALAGAGKALAIAGKSMLATSDAVALATKAKPPLSYVDSLKLRVAERAPTEALAPPRRLLPAPPKVTAEAVVPAGAAAPVATTRDWVVSNIAASKASHATPAYQAFDRAVTAAALARATPPVVPTNSSTPSPRVERPIYDHTTYEPMEPSRIPTRETAQPTTFHRRVETVPAYGHLYDVELACMRHECGTWSLFAQKFTPHNPQALASALSGRVLAKLRSALIHVAKDHLDAQAVVVQWNPEVLGGLSDVAAEAAKRTVHYAGERPAMETLTPIGSLQRLGKAALGASLDIPGKALPIDGHPRSEDKAYTSDALSYAGHFFVDGSRGTRPISTTDSLLTAVRSLTRKERAVPTMTFDLQRTRRNAPSSPKEALALEDSPAAPANPAPQGGNGAKPLSERASVITSDRPVSSGMHPVGETVVVVESTYDTTGAFTNPITARVQDLARGRNLIYRRVDSIEGIRDAMQQIGNVSHVLVRAHGNPRAIHLDSFGTKPEALAYALRKECMTLSRRAEVFLEACSTAAKPRDGSESFAQKLSFRLGDRASVVAARAPVIPNYTQMRPGSVRFYGELDRDLLNIAIPNHLRRPELTFRIGRINNSEGYTKLIRRERIPSSSKYLHFSETPKVFSGVIPRDLIFVQYHNAIAFNTWFVSAEDAMELTTMDALRRKTVLSESISSFTHMTVTRIPAGENINTLRGNVTSEGKWDKTVHRSEITQYYFYDFDPKWESITLPWPCSAEGLDNFDALVNAATESRDPRRILSLRSKTVYQEIKPPSIRQPLPNPVEAEEASLLAKPSIPPISDAVPETFQEILTNIEYDGVSAYLRISHIAHKDGTSRVFVEHLIVQDFEVGDQTFTSGLIFQTLTTIRDIAKKEWGASRVFIQWDPMNPKCQAPSFQAHLERYRHYVGLHDAYPLHPELMVKYLANEELKHLKYPTLVYDLKMPSLEEEIPASGETVASRRAEKARPLSLEMKPTP